MPGQGGKQGAPGPAAAGQDERELLELLLEASTDGVMDWDLAGERIRYTARWKLLLGYEAQELEDSPGLWSALTHPEDLPRVRELLNEHLESIWPFTHTWRMKHANGEWRWVLCRAITARDEQARPARLVAVFSDITESIRAEERQRAIVRAIPDLLLRVGRDGLLIDVKTPEGPASPVYLPWPVPGRPLRDWAAASSWCDRITAVLEEGTAAPPREFEVTIAAGGQRRHAEVRVVPSGPLEAVCIVRDVTEQRQLQGQLLQAHKLESIGQLAAGIAHEINTPMQYVGDNLTFIQDAHTAYAALVAAQDRVLAGAAAEGRPVRDDERAEIARLREEHDLEYLQENVPRSLEGALEGVKRVARIVSAMKEFSHPGRTAKSDADLNHEIETTITISSNAWKYVADMERDFDPGLPSVPCYAGEINQVVLNLIVNAAHAIADAAAADPDRPRGRITVATRRVEAGAEIRISDTGTGIPESVRQRIFDPFFTTKEVGRGTGQGLTIARSTVVDKHGGSIDFETELGRGTTFIVRLPLAQANDAGPPQEG